jgi:methionyl-tRNA synthetase
MPATTEILWESLGANKALGPIGTQKVSEIARWGQLPAGVSITKTPVLFPRLEVKE